MCVCICVLVNALGFYSSVNTIKIISSTGRSVNLLKLLPGRLRPPWQLTSAKWILWQSRPTDSGRMMTEITSRCYVAGLGFKFMTPGFAGRCETNYPKLGHLVLALSLRKQSKKLAKTVLPPCQYGSIYYYFFFFVRREFASGKQTVFFFVRTPFQIGLW